MKCPNCGQEIQADHLYCEKCGMEIRIVPDFEPEIENSINETLSTVAEEIDNKSSKTSEETGNNKEWEESDEILTEEAGKNWLVFKTVSLIAVILIAVSFTLLMYFNYSTSFQIENAKKYAQQGKYEEALELLEKAASNDEDNAQIALLRSEYYHEIGHTDQAVEVLEKLLERGEPAPDDVEKVYDSIISLYHEQGKYDKINELLIGCKEDSIITLFQQYMAFEPEYSYESGTYDEIIYLRLNANTTGTIYYTLDGSTPTAASMKYTAPILLESGRYQVNAVFVNDYGIESNVVRNWFEINLAMPDAPVVIPESGSYENPTMIEVEIPEDGTVYYTTDRSDPNVDSMKYVEPISMPLGRSNYKFIVISDDGVQSEIVSRSYNFSMNTSVTVDRAVSNVINALMQRNVLIDTNGHAPGVSGRYIFKYNSIVQIGENYYYILNEYFVDGNGNEKMEERMYAVEVYTGTPNRLIYDEQGQMGLIPLTDS